MAQESAKTFVNKMYTDDGFLKEIVRHGGMKRGEADQNNELILKAAGEMGFDFTAEEYRGATKEYFGGSFLKVIRTLWHVNKVVKQAQKEIR